MFGPLRMFLDLPTRRRKERPPTLPLKVKVNPDDDWSFVHVKREEYPFLFGFPHYALPDEISGITTTGRRDSATKTPWPRAISSRHTEPIHLEMLCQRLGVASVMPTAKCDTVAFCLMLAKIAHSFAVAELGLNGFEAFLLDMIRRADMSNRAQYIGASPEREGYHISLHELWFDSRIAHRRDIISVRIRLLAPFGSPVYYVAVGRK
jgi:hypothetical protein